MKKLAPIAFLIFVSLLSTPTLAFSHTEESQLSEQEQALQIKKDKLRSINKKITDEFREKKHREEGFGQTLRERKDKFLELWSEDPSAAEEFLFPGYLRKALPKELHDDVEQPADVTGHMEIIVEDYDDYAKYRYYVRDSKNSHVEVFFADSDVASKLHSGDKLRVKGYRLDHQLLIPTGVVRDHEVMDDSDPETIHTLAVTEGASEGNVTVLESLVVPLSDTHGEQKTLVVLVNFTDKQTQPFTVAAAQTHFFGTTGSTVNRWYQEVSFGKTWLTGTVLGWFTLPISSTTVCSDVNQIRVEAMKAVDAQVFFPDYHRIVIAFPGSACSWKGRATIGKDTFMNQPDGQFSLSVAWLNYNGLSLRYSAHELGHNFGLNHARAMDCGSGFFAPSGCTVKEYGDPIDIMGEAGTWHFQAIYKEQLGWFSGSQVVEILTSGTTTQAISADETGDASLKVVKVVQWHYPNGNRDLFTIENREAIGFDAGLSSNTSMLLGARIHHYQGLVSSLLDMTPATNIYSDAALPVGQSAVDPSGITFTHLGNSSGLLNVRISVPADTLPPQISIHSPEPGGFLTGAADSLRVSGGDNRGIAAVRLFLNSTMISQRTSAPYDDLVWNSAAFPDGSYTFKAQIQDTAGYVVDSQPISLNIDNTLPTVTITSPSANAILTGQVPVNVTANDTSGIGFVILLLDGVSLDYLVTPPFNFILNTASYPEGAHTLSVKAYDNALLTRSVSLPLTFQNSNQPPVLDVIGDKTVAAGSLLSFGISASDADGGPISLTARLGSGGALSTIGATLIDDGSGTGSVLRVFSWTPSASQVGDHHIYFTASDGESEDNELITIQVTASAVPDLIVNSLSAPTSLITGTTVNVTSQIKNAGNTSVSSSSTRFYLSTDTTITTTDISLGTQSVATLAAGASTAVTTTSVTIPNTLAPGTYYLGAIADYSNARIESNEMNNTRATGAIPVTVGADLIVNSLSGPASLVTGTTVNVTSQVKNAGSGSVSGSSTRFYLSTDTTITTADISLGTQSVAALAAGASTAVTTTVVTIPNTLVPGTYYLGAIADYSNARIESNETNNTKATSATPVTAGADLVVLSISAPSTAARGATIGVTHQVRNQGTGSVGSSSLGIYLSTDNVITTADKKIGTYGTPTLAAGASNALVTTNVVVPSTMTAGTYFIGGISDYSATRYESNEANNAKAGNTVTVN